MPPWLAVPPDDFQYPLVCHYILPIGRRPAGGRLDIPGTSITDKKLQYLCVCVYCLWSHCRLGFLFFLPGCGFENFGWLYGFWRWDDFRRIWFPPLYFAGVPFSKKRHKSLGSLLGQRCLLAGCLLCLFSEYKEKLVILQPIGIIVVRKQG